ncbi:copper chaperone PCu(A)C [Metapseudomonas lalkuanensis]|jgi:copper(I)-binding protein|uniref:Copper chaperone PCu(A)C n=1 Tax=Metapseudomonas lalkuanensis TaxID=2604832 RepID=A0A5J6QT95_9GAMM|nr:copper chaperone PCu(A)C [Pseudomonas lalkuanensis]QEY65647.1 copper chaperone PCu(A)C [Pseudomonas lalkuanensis]UCO98197.1 copper chaperone PCu(A)C [Pseudomonas lalkuanensis]
MRKTLLALGALLSFSGTLAAHDYNLGSLHIEHPWAMAVPAVSPNGAAYLVIHNRGTDTDMLLGADTVRAGKTEIHEHLHKDGLMKMQKVEGGVAIPAGGQARFEQGGYHLMMFGLKQPLNDGDKFPMTLHFQKAGDLDVEVHVQTQAPAVTAEHQH